MTPSREAMKAAALIMGPPMSQNEYAALIDDAFRPLRESHERLREALVAADKVVRYLAPQSPSVERTAAALAQVPR